MELSSGGSTKTRSSCFSNVLVRPVLVAFCIMCTGCLYPNPEGKWTGRIVPATVFDSHGEAYETAALKIESGTDWDKQLGMLHTPPRDERGVKYIPESAGGGNLPLLAKGEIPRIVPSDEMPIGQRVTVYGTMYYGGVSVKHARKGDLGVVRDRLPMSVEHIVRIHRFVVCE